MVGSGPFRWKADEYVTGSRAVYVRNDAYRPRDEKVDYCAGGYRALVDRVEWRIIADPGTAVSALLTGEVDWIEQPLPDLLPRLRRAPGITVAPTDIYGTFAALRFNQSNSPTDNAAIRRAMLACVNQLDVMTAMMGDAKELYRAPVGYFLPGTPSETEAGMEAVRTRRSEAELARHAQGGRLCRRAHRAAAPHRPDLLRRRQPRGAGRLPPRRPQHRRRDHRLGHRGAAPRLARTAGPRRLVAVPAWAAGGRIPRPDLRQHGARQRPGRLLRLATDPIGEGLRDRWIDSTDPAEQKRLDAEIQTQAFRQGPFIPLGQYFPPAAWRSTLTAPQKGVVPVFWEVAKA